MNINRRYFFVLVAIFATIVGSWLIATLSEWMTNDGVQFVALGLFAGASLIGCIGFGWWLTNALVQIWRHDERNEYLSTPEGRERIFAREFDEEVKFKEIGNTTVTKVITFPPRLRPAEPLEKAQLDGELFNLLVKNGGKVHEHN